MKEMINSNGKLFAATESILPAYAASSIPPSYILKALDGQQCRLFQDLVQARPASLLTISCSSFSDPHVESFREPFLASEVPRCGIIDLRPIPSRIKYAVWGMLVKRAARKTVPEALHRSYFVYRGGNELRSMLDITNLFAGYTFIIDRNGCIRWRACGTATEPELKSMFNCFNLLS